MSITVSMFWLIVISAGRQVSNHTNNTCIGTSSVICGTGSTRATTGGRGVRPPNLDGPQQLFWGDW